MRAVNLLPPDQQRASFDGGRAPVLVLAVGIAVVTVVAVGLGMSAGSSASASRDELAFVEGSIAALPRPPAQAVSQGVLAQERSDRLEALNAALSTQVAFDRVLREISYLLPRDAWLTGLRAVAPVGLSDPAEQPSGSSATTVEGVTIEGATYSLDGVARVLSRFSAAPSLENVRLTTSTRVEPQVDTETTPSGKGKKKKTPKAKTVVTFTIVASLRSKGSS
jgi:Tfp pilus assembly protein PilN